MTIPCLCYSGKSYQECCKPFHTGKQLPKTALELMRSRYCAYAKGLVDYLIQTTHPQNVLFENSRQDIEEGIRKFSQATQFTGLDIIEFIDGEKEAFVTFKAHLVQDQDDVSFQEKSRFLKENDRWLYHSGDYQRKER